MFSLFQVCRRRQFQHISQTFRLVSRLYNTANVFQRNGVKHRYFKKPQPQLQSLTHPHTNVDDIPPVPITKTRRHPPKRLPTISLNDFRKLLEKEILPWAQTKTTLTRLKSMGVSLHDSKILLTQFLEEENRPPEGWFPPSEDNLWEIDRALLESREDSKFAIDAACSRRFVQWAVDTGDEFVPKEVTDQLRAVQEAVDLRRPEFWSSRARALNRKFIMHVGPTNSGKTHNALRALAGSRIGAYAGPLRLLAYEIFDRFNSGKILPPDADPSLPPETYKRACNLLTGEEIRTVDPYAPLTSCTVEMLLDSSSYEVLVIDEIQMIMDPQRGSAWTNAILSSRAQEIHLCGEESVVPLISSILATTGDTLTIKHYSRLTPLEVASKSLNRNWKEIQKGDCVVTFSREDIFEVKREVEKATGLRCAIVYGRLPPEVRSEQAALFNDPDSGYDVLIGSDALGMGLNLKIKRIVFAHTSKFDGARERKLSFSQIKQIAGRAGRYGLHGDEVGGIVTAMTEHDLKVIRKAMSQPASVTPSATSDASDVSSSNTTATSNVSVTKGVALRATLPSTAEQHRALEILLPQPTSHFTLCDIRSHLARLSPLYQLSQNERGGEGASAIDAICNGMTLFERLTFQNAPVNWRDEKVASAMLRFLRSYKESYEVDLRSILSSMGFLDPFVRLREIKESGSESLATPAILNTLESLYRILTMYLWLSYRYPISFGGREDVAEIKRDVEGVINWAIEGIKGRKVTERESRENIMWEPRRTTRREWEQNLEREPAVIRELFDAVSGSGANVTRGDLEETVKESVITEGKVQTLI